MRHRLQMKLAFALVLFAFLGRPVLAQRPLAAPPDVAGDELGRLREELQTLRREYAERIAALEARLSAVESGGQPAAVIARPTTGPTSAALVPDQPSVAVPAGAAGAGGPTGALPVYGGGGAAPKGFNPDIAAIGDFIAPAGRTPRG